jgi:hypothetical protein
MIVVHIMNSKVLKHVYNHVLQLIHSIILFKEEHNVYHHVIKHNMYIHKIRYVLKNVILMMVMLYKIQLILVIINVIGI